MRSAIRVNGTAIILRSHITKVFIDSTLSTVGTKIKSAIIAIVDSSWLEWVEKDRMLIMVISTNRLCFLNRFLPSDTLN